MTGFNMTIAMAAKKFNISRVTIYSWIRDRGLESMEYTPEWGGKKTTLVCESDIAEMIERREAAKAQKIILERTWHE